ncbi:MAG: hypothetical protein LBG96_01315 [Tannerella sp.]|jgi:hypothetical protein|nr:hypothetical protein [Tannerella sp.]
MKKAEFLGDTKRLLRPDEIYDAQEAYRIVKEKIIENQNIIQFLRTD